VSVLVLGGFAVMALISSVYVVLLLEIIQLRRVRALRPFRRDPGDVPQSGRAA
jgi:hypothetical protein